jgi:tetratricopeptide (TPR) repeat protein
MDIYDPLKIHQQIKIDIKNNNYIQAIENYKKIIDLNPVNVTVYLKELGEIYEKLNMYLDAIPCFVKILKTETNVSITGPLLNQIGICYFNTKSYKLAIHYFNKVINIKEIPDVYNNIGLSYIALKNYNEAESTFLKSYNINKNIFSCSSLGQVYYYKKNYNKSIKFYSKIKADVKQLYNMSMPYLGKKDFKKGFELYENRLQINNINPQTNLVDRLEVPLPYWNGKDSCNKLLIIYEQGLGDNIQYYRFIIELSEKYPNMKIFYFCKKEISNIFNTYNNITIIKEVVIYIYDFKVYIMSLPKLLNLSTISPNQINYIKTNNDKLIYWKDKMSQVKKFKVGFVYNGLLSSFIEKNIPLNEYKILSDLNIDLICIHRKNEIETDLNTINFKEKIISYDIDVDTPFEDTICLLQNIDLLITVDTYIAHLAGVLNVKTWLLLGKTDWRWSDDVDKTYWYNSIELIRTVENEEFKGLLIKVKDKLVNLV